MTKLNSLSFAVALSLSVIPLKSEAIGLGQYESNAQLNQPLNLSIPLLTEHDDLSGFKAYLADYSQHDRFGIIFPGWMPKIKANVIKGNNGYQLMLTTNRPIKEPIVNFILAVDYQGMKLYKEITLFLDPPTNLQRTGEIISQSVAVSNFKAEVAPQSQQVKPSVASRISDPNRVKRGDSLWKLAARWDLKGSSQQEKMDLLFQNNAHAFIDGNRELIKEGSLISYSSELVASNDAEIRQAESTQTESRLTSNVSNSSVPQTVILENNIELSTENSNSSQAIYQQNKIEQMQQKISLLDQTITQQLEENQQLKVQLNQIETLIANLQQGSTTAATLPVAAATESTTPIAKTDQAPKPLGPAIYPTSPSQTQTSMLDSLSPNLFLLYWSIGLLGIGLITQRLFNQWKFNRFNKRLDKQLSKLKASTSPVAPPVPSIDELKLPKETSLANRIKYIQSAANFYLRCHRFDLAKELVNESLIQYASNSRIVKELLELRRTIYQTIDKGLKTDIVEKLDGQSSEVHSTEDNIEPFDQYGQRWNRKVS